MTTPDSDAMGVVTLAILVCLLLAVCYRPGSTPLVDLPPILGSNRQLSDPL